MKNTFIFLFAGALFAIPCTLQAQWTQGTGKVTLTYSGSVVGIGVINPQERVHIKGNLRTENPSNSSDYLLLGSVGDSFVDVNGGDNLDLRVSGNTSARLRGDDGSFQVTTQLRVGNPAVPNGYIASFNGKIVAEELLVDARTDWPDYVFDTDYPLMDLAELNNFIAKNKHLPNIPSAKEIAEKGIDLGAMNTKLLEKVEELMLYTIQQQKEIDGLELLLKTKKN